MDTQEQLEHLGGQIALLEQFIMGVVSLSGNLPQLKQKLEDEGHNLPTGQFVAVGELDEFKGYALESRSSSHTTTPLEIDGLKIPESGYMQIVETKDGGMLIGRIISIDVDVVQVETSFGKTEIPIRAIKKIRRIPESSMRNGKHWYPDLNTTRLFITTL